jgi:hypothetical protein
VTHDGDQSTLPSSVAEYAPPTSKVRNELISKSSFASLGPTHGEHHNTTLDVLQSPPLLVIDISDDTDYSMYDAPSLIKVSNCDSQTEAPTRK